MGESSKQRQTARKALPSTRLHGVTSQKIILLIASTVRTSNLTQAFNSLTNNYSSMFTNLFSLLRQHNWSRPLQLSPPVTDRHLTPFQFPNNTSLITPITSHCLSLHLETWTTKNKHQSIRLRAKADLSYFEGSCIRKRTSVLPTSRRTEQFLEHTQTQACVRRLQLTSTPPCQLTGAHYVMHGNGEDEVIQYDAMKTYGRVEVWLHHSWPRY
jgi:hypothetical protein